MSAVRGTEEQVAGRARTKQRLVSEVCELLNLRTVEQSAGSTIPKAFYREVASILGIDCRADEPGLDVAQKIVAAAGLRWPTGADSTNTPSGGGGTITAVGLAAVRDAVIELRERSLMSSSSHSETQQEVEDDQEVAEVRPGVHSLKIYENFNNNWWFALAELVDNSIASYERLLLEYPDASIPQLAVDITLSQTEVVVRDNAGGIDAKNLRRALQVGTTPEDLSKLNQYGIGMKTSVFWIGKSVAITTTERNSSIERSLRLDLTKIQNDHDTVPIKKSLAVYESHGTTITVSKLSRGKPQTSTLTKTQRHLASIYRKYLDSGLLVLRIDGEKIEFEPLTIVNAPLWKITSDGAKVATDQEPRLWKRDFSVVVPASLDSASSPRDRTVTGWVGIFEHGKRREGKREFAGIQGFWRNRVVLGLSGGGQSFIDTEFAWKPKELGLSGNMFPSLRLTGEVNLDDFTVGTHKNSINWNQEQQTFLWKEVRKLLEAEHFYAMMEAYAPSGSRKRPTKNPRGAPTPPAVPLPPIPAPGPRAPENPSGPTPEIPTGSKRDLSTVEWEGGEVTAIDLRNVREPFELLLNFEGVDSTRAHFTALLNEASRYVRTFHPSPDSLEEIETIGAAFAHAQLWMRTRHADAAEFARQFHVYFEYALERICVAHELREQMK